VFAPVVLSALFRPHTLFPNLWLWHAARIPETFRTPTEPIQPHFGWPGSARLLDLALPTSDPRVAGALVSLLACAFFGVVLFLLFRRTDTATTLLGPTAAVTVSVAVALLENPAALQGWEAVADPDRSFLPLYYGFVPTTVASMGLNVLVVWMTARLLMGTLSARGARWLPWLVVLTAIVKPNVVPTLAAVALGAAVVITLRPGRTTRPPAAAGPSIVTDVALRVTLPAAAVTVLQFLVLADLSPPVLEGGVELRPLYELGELGGFGWQFWLLAIFPLAALALLRRRLLADLAVSMCLGCFAVGVLAALLFARSGSTVYQGEVGGDIVQLASAAAALLVIFVVRRVLELRTLGQVSTVASIVLVAVLVPYLLAGLSTWRCHSGLAECYPRSTAPSWPQPGIDERIDITPPSDR
jgi:hypothetical protein